jgi:pyridoxal phosphate enzyme (YggS family)
VKTLAENIAAVEARIQAACRRARRARTEVTLVGVTKSITTEVASMLPALGLNHLGESRPQELVRKARAMPPTVQWHLIGHLQRNKIELVLPVVACIHSVDSVRLLHALEQQAARLARTLPVFLEFNASGEQQKLGFDPKDTGTLGAVLKELQHVQVKGLMTMAALQDAELCRPTFALLRGFRERLRSEIGPPHTFEHLSMGMSNDFEVAIEEGATMVRLGTVLFESLGERAS